MNKDQIFIGTIRKCTTYEVRSVFCHSTHIDGQCIGVDGIGYNLIDSEIYKENAILIDLKDRGYIDLESLDSFLDCIRVYQTYGYGLDLMSFSPNHIGELFVDASTLRPYYDTAQKSKHVSVYQLKKQVGASK